MRRFRIRPALIGFLLALVWTPPVWSQAPPNPIDNEDDVHQYAKGCYQAFGLAAADIAKLEPAAGFDCKPNGVLLGTQWTVKTKTHALSVTDTATKWPDGTARGPTDFPPECDFPAWLTDKCYGHTYVQKLHKTFGITKEGFSATMLCRHKGVWSDDNNTFDDIAIIMHDRSSGNTCWFQAEAPAMAGTGVVPPSKDDAADPANRFWLSPKVTASVHCVGCHDNGPFMHSIWITRSDGVPTDGKGPYINPGKAFSGWAEPLFVSVAGEGIKLKGGKRSCTGCHRISKTLYKGQAAGDTSRGDGEEQGSHGRWIDWVTGTGFASKTSAFGRTWQQAGWMPSKDHPPTHGFKTLKDFTDVYGAHLTKLKDCQHNPAPPPAPGMDPTPVNGCSAAADASLLAANTANLQPTTVAMTATLGSGPALTSTATLDQQFVYGFLLARSGDSATFTWEAQGVTACVTEVTMPPFVYFGDLQSASNFGGETGSESIGPLTVPGQYVFDLNCDGPYATASEDEDIAHLTAQVVVQVVQDDFLCYESHHPADRRSGIQVEDIFGDATLDLKKPRRLCNPVLDGDPVEDHPDHLVGYAARPSDGAFERREDVEVTDRFGTVRVDLVGVDYLLVPSAKSLTGPPPTPYTPAIDHFRCSKVRGTRINATLEAEDQFGTIVFDLKKPVRLCSATRKNEEPLLNAAAHLLCYRTRPARGAPVFRGLDDPVSVSNQFGLDQLDIAHLREVCVQAAVVN